MIKLSVFSDDLAMDWARAVQVAQQLDLQGLEIRNVWGRSSKDLSDEEARSMAAVLKGTGLEVSCMGSAYGRQFWMDDPEARKMSENVLAKMIRFCDIFGTDKIRIFALWIRDYDQKARWSARPRYTLDLLTRIVKNLEPSIRMAEKAGVRLLIEPEGNSYSGTCRETRTIVEAIDSAAVRCVYHPRVTTDTGEPAYPDGYNQVRPYYVHVHMGRLDYYWAKSEPTIPHQQVLRALVADKYDGWITIERHHAKDPDQNPELREQTVQDLNAVRSMLHEEQARA